MEAEDRSFEAAFADFDRAGQVEPNNPDLHDRYGNALAASGADARSLDEYNKGLQLAPGDAILLIDRGIVYLHMKDLDRADADFTQAIASDPKNWAGYYNRALVSEQRAQFDRAVRDLDAALAIVPGKAIILKLRGDVYADLDDYARAVQDYDAAIRATPDYPEAYRQRAAAKEKLGDAAGAAADRAHAAELPSPASN